MYKLVFSKAFDEGINSSYNYIKKTLEAPRAAENLISEKCVNVIRFMHIRRDWLKILKEKPLNEIM